MFSLLLLLIIIIIINIIIIIICQFRLVSPRSYNVAFIPTLNKFPKQTKKQTQNLIYAWKTYVVRGSDLTVDKIMTKNLKGCKNCECYVSKKIQETNIGFSNWSFFVVFFLSVSSVFITFHSHFWLSLEQQSGRGHISISIKYQENYNLCHHEEIKIKRLYRIFRKII